MPKSVTQFPLFSIMLFLAGLAIQTQWKGKACGTEHFGVIVQLQIQTWQLKYSDCTGENRKNGRNEEQLLQSCQKQCSFQKCLMAETKSHIDIADGYIMLRVLSVCSCKSSCSCAFQNLSLRQLNIHIKFSVLYSRRNDGNMNCT